MEKSQPTDNWTALSNLVGNGGFDDCLDIRCPCFFIVSCIGAEFTSYLTRDPMRDSSRRGFCVNLSMESGESYLRIYMTIRLT